ncbi:MAG: NINE protein [Flavobacteriaceae bacterium]|nr:NINE protein [Flavobacteriaceae bacterium]
MEETSNKLSEDNFKFCADCGKKISKKALSCPNCGSPIIKPGTQNAENRFITTLLLCWFLGVFGVHRFYTGHTLIGVLQLITLGGCGIWTLIDFIMILLGNFKDSDGVKIKTS